MARNLETSPGTRLLRSLTLLAENIRIAWRSVRSNMLRSVLTILIIAVGIAALVGILTAIDAIKYSITEEFASMGANTFSISSRGMTVQIGEQRYRTKNHAYISYYQARDFKEQFTFPAITSISVFSTGTATVKFDTRKTNPNVSVRGIDENFLETAGYELERGRGLSPSDIAEGRNVVLLGASLVSALFKNLGDPLNKVISIGGGKYRIIGILKEKGNSFGMAGDNVCFIPYNNARTYFPRPNLNFQIQVKVERTELMEVAIGQAEACFRKIRNLDPLDESDFNIDKSDNLANILIENLKNVSLVATIIGLITMFGAAIGLMNIMLVSVTERTREIGIRKAIGAASSTVRQQFLVEAILVGQLGGAVGIVLGMIAGNLVAKLVGTSFIVPWAWIILASVLCFFVAIISGYYPALKASRLDPIESLRYE